MQADISSVLDRVGLTEGERAVYLALLEIGESTSGPIAEESGVSASKVYQVCERLMDKGLVGQTKRSGVKHFSATPPQSLLFYLKRQQAELHELQTQAQRILPELQKRHDAKKEDTDIQLFRGMKSLHNLYFGMIDELDPSEEYQVIGARIGSTDQPRHQRFFRKLEQHRHRSGVQARLLYQRSREPDPEHLTDEYRPLPPVFNSPLQILTYRDSTVLLLAQEEPILVRIGNRAVTDSFRQFFEQLWNQDAQVFEGMQAFTAAFDDMLDELDPDEEYLVLGATTGTGDYDTIKEFFGPWHDRRAAKGVRTRLLLQTNTQASGSDELREVKYLPDEFRSPLQINIYRDKLILILVEQTPIVFTLRNATIADSFRQYFEQLWNQDVRTLRGRYGIETMLEDYFSSGEDLYLIGAHGLLRDRYPDLFDRWTQHRVDSGTQCFMLCQERVRGSAFATAANMQPSYLPEQFFGPLVIWIFGDTVVQALWEQPETLFVIHNASVAQDYMKYYRMLEDSAVD